MPNVLIIVNLCSMFKFLFLLYFGFHVKLKRGTKYEFLG
jgi:hypothetical protein